MNYLLQCYGSARIRVKSPFPTEYSRNFREVVEKFTSQDFSLIYFILPGVPNPSYFQVYSLHFSKSQFLEQGHQGRVQNQNIRMKKMVLKSSIEDEKSKRKALKAVAGLEGVESVAVDMKEKKITVIGVADPVFLTSKLRKFAYTELLTVGPAKEEKKEAPKQEQKKEEKKTEPAPTILYYPTSYSYSHSHDHRPYSHDHRPYQEPVDSDEYSYCTIC